MIYGEGIHSICIKDHHHLWGSQMFTYKNDLAHMAYCHLSQQCHVVHDLWLFSSYCPTS